MASKWFEGLSAQAQGFLIGSLLFRSKEHEALFLLLDPSDAEILKARAAAILELERGQRVKLLVAELKRLLLLSSQPWLLAVDPSWIAHILAKEDQQVQRAALVALPKPLAKILSPTETEPMPNLKSSVVTAIRRAIEKQLTPMRAVSFDQVFTASHLLILTKSELEIVIIEVGKSGIAAVMAAVGLDNAAKELEKISKPTQASIIAELKAVKAIAWLNEQQSAAYLSRIFQAEHPARNYFYNCGLELFALMLSKSPSSLQKEIAQRLDFEAGQKMLAFVRASDVQLDLPVFSRVIELAKERKIDERFGKCSLPQ